VGGSTMKSSLKKFLGLFFEDIDYPSKHSKPIEIVIAIVYSIFFLYWIIDGIFLFNKIDLSNIRDFIIPLFLIFTTIIFITSRRK
jgi:hypothetical protein